MAQRGFHTLLATVVLAGGYSLGATLAVPAEKPAATRPSSVQATSNTTARQEAVKSIPLDKLDAQARAKVDSVLSAVTAFRRMPVRVIDCDPELYVFLVRHPDVVVNIWEVLKLSQLQVRQTGPDSYRVVEADGTAGTFEFIYRSHDTHVIYAEGTYAGPWFPRPVKGRGLVVLKTGYVRETDGRYYITSRMDAFLSVEPGAVEVVTKAVHPLLGKIADNNFIQAIGFVGGLSRTAEVNSRGVQRLADKLTHVQPELRQQLAELAAGVARKADPAAADGADAKPPTVASRASTATKR
jgi:hypothetical protein